MTSWPAWAAMAGGHNRRGSTGGVGHARRSWNAVRDDYPRPSLTGNAARALPFPKSQRPTCPLSFTPGGTPPAPYGPPRHPPPPGVSRFRRFRCYLDRPPASHSSLPHPPLPGVSLFWRFHCYLDCPHARHGPLRHPPPPGMSLFRRFRCYLDRPHASHSSLRHPPPPGVSLFRRFRCHLNHQPAPYGPPRHPPLLGVSRFRRIGSHLRRVTRHPARHYGSGHPGTGSLLRCFCVEQEAARSRCALKTGNQLCETRRFRALITALVRRPVEHPPGAWNIAVRTRGVFTHRDNFLKPACVERGLVRTGWRGGEAAGGNGQTEREQELAETDRREQARTSGNRSRQKRASAGRRHSMPSIQQGGPAKRPALLTPGSQVEKSIGFPYVGEETR